MPNAITTKESFKLHKENAIKELDLMHKAVDQGNFKRAKRHKIIAGVAIDDMIRVSKMVEEN